jgi:hypothetical protein
MKKYLSILCSLLTFQSFSQIDKGDVKFVFEQPSNPKYNQYYRDLYFNNCLDHLAQYMNSTYNFQRDIIITFNDVKEEHNANSNLRGNITIYYKILDDYIQNTPVVESTNRVSNAISFVILHELGHELIAQLKLPITGKEENAVDEFAIIQLLNNSNDLRMRDASIFGAFNWYADSKNYGSTNFSGEHAPNMERYYDMLAMIYSKLRQQNIVSDTKDLFLPSRRAEKCINDYEVKRRNWNQILGNYMKLNNQKTTQLSIKQKQKPKFDDGW